MKKLLLFIFLCPLFTKAQNITTVAGGGSTVSYGDGGPATAGSLSTPFGLTVDRSGNLTNVAGDLFG